mgnify:CR=1 FL=1
MLGMDTITLSCGSIFNHAHGPQRDLIPVQFQGECLGKAKQFLDQGDDRYFEWELYKDESGNYWLYNCYVSHWQNEERSYELEPVQLEDFQRDGDRADLGRKLGLWEIPLSPQEYLEYREKKA